MFKNKTIIPWLVAAVAVVAVIVTFLGGTKTSVASGVNTATVTTVTRAESIDASGYIQAQSYASLGWKTSGTVASVPISAGDHVKAGDVLMSLQITSASANVISARADLINAQKQHNSLQNPDGETIAAAQKKLASAYSAWDTARDDLSSALSGKSSYGKSKNYDTMTSAETDLADALDAFALSANPDSQWYYWAARMDSLNRSDDYDYTSLASKLRNNLNSDDANFVDDIVDAQKKYEAAVQVFAESITDYSTAVTVNDAKATYQQSAEALMNASQDAYETLVAPNSNDLASALAKVDAAQTTVDSLSIIAPFDGEVLAIEQNPGDVVSTDTIAISLADRTNLSIDTQVDEADIAQVVVGNPVIVSMDALPGVTLNGTVTFINPVSELVSGLVKYIVHIELAPVNAPVLLGATADVTIQVSDPQTSVAVPITAIQNDSTGEYVWVIQSDGSTKRVDVVSGSIVGDQVIVSGDVQAGDQIQLVQTSSVASPNALGPLSGGK